MAPQNQAVQVPVKSKSPLAGLRSDVPVNYWPKRSEQRFQHIGHHVFRLFAIPGGGETLFELRNVEAFAWSDAEAQMTGSVTFRDPTFGPGIDLAAGQQIRCYVADNEEAPYRVLWTMRIQKPGLNLPSGQHTVQLVNDLWLLHQSTDDFKYTTHRRTKVQGWGADEITYDIANQYGVPVAPLPKAKFRIKNLVMLNTNPILVLIDAWNREARHTGNHYVVTYYDNLLSVKPFTRSEFLRNVGETVLEARKQESFGDNFATAVTVRTLDPQSGIETPDAKGHRKRVVDKGTANVSSADSVSKYGYIHRVLYSPDARTPAEAQREGQMWLTVVARPDVTWTFSHRGDPTLHRNDAIRLIFDRYGVSQILYVTDVTHTVTGRDYTMEVTAAFSDPHIFRRDARILTYLTDAAQQNGRVPPDGTKVKPPPAPKHHAQKAEHYGAVITAEGAKFQGTV